MSFWSRWSYWLAFLILSVLVVGLTETGGDGAPEVPDAAVTAAAPEPLRPWPSAPSAQTTSAPSSPISAPGPQGGAGAAPSERRLSLHRFATADSFQVLAASILAQPTKVAVEDLRLYHSRCRFVLSQSGPDGHADPAQVERFRKFCGEDVRQRNNLSYAIDGAYARLGDASQVWKDWLAATRHALAEGDSERAVESLSTVSAEQLMQWAQAQGIQDPTLGLEAQVAYNGHILALFSTQCAITGCDQRYWSAFYCSQIPSTCQGATLDAQLQLTFAELVGDPDKARALWPELLRRAREFRRSQLGQG
ncbi:hypothetical protein [Roseateles sp.]|uniref:hypothetical protein n=1 Tax=Roseateles sp. TaxID=1971397 RepID=UPI0031D1ED33